MSSPDAANVPADVVPWSYEVRAFDGDRLVASSRSARYVLRDDDDPVLMFPLTDVLVDLDELPADALIADAPEGHVGLDHRVVRVEFLDVPDDDPSGSGTAMRFPAWGDVDDLVGVLDVERLASGRYAAQLRPGRERTIVEASQLLAQAAVAACREVPDRRVISAAMTFTRIVHDAVPYEFDLDQVSSGRSFSSFVVHVVQDDRRCASAVLLLGLPSDEVLRHADPAPEVPGPWESVPLDMSVIGRDLRVVDGAYTNDSDAPVGPPVIDAWMRYRGAPADPVLHMALLVQFFGHMSIAAAMRPHAGVGQDQAHRTLSTAPLSIQLAVHADVRADDWMLVHHRSTWAADGLTRATNTVHDHDGALLASFDVDSMLRPFAASTPIDGRAAL